MSGDYSFEIAVNKLMSMSTQYHATTDERLRQRKHRMHALLKRLDHPHLAVPTIHVAGTNGKGSTAAMITSILTSAGLRVGLFTSPHLHSFVERIRLGLTPITRQQFADLFSCLWPAAEAVANDPKFPNDSGKLTTLEFLTGMAFHYFRQTNASYQVIETFVGGRHDITNLVRPILSVITNISRDHIPALGDTLLDIARAKAGIIKKGAPVVIAPQRQPVHSVLKREAAKVGTKIEMVKATSLTTNHYSVERLAQPLHWRGRYGQYNVTFPLIGKGQAENAALAITAVENLIDLNAPIKPRDICHGLRHVSWPARFELLQKNPVPVICDGAHCPHAMSQLVSELKRLRPIRPILALVGGQQGHDTPATLRLLHPHVAAIFVSQSRHPRALPARILADKLHRPGVTVQASSLTVPETLQKMITGASSHQLIVATGSLSIAAEAREALHPSIEVDHYS